MSQVIRLGPGINPALFVQTITGNTGGPVPPTLGNINLIGSGNITVTGNPGTSTLDITLVGTTNHAVQVGNAAGSLTSIPVGNDGQVLIGAGANDPAFAYLTSPDNSITFVTGANSLALSVTGGTTVGKTITGNTGGPLSPTAGNWNIVTANSIPIFAGAGSTLTLDFALTNNLLLGSSGSITVGNTNVGYGKLAAASISSGSSNSFIGYEAGVGYTTGSNTTTLGAFSMFSAVAGASNNTAIGYTSLYNLAGAGTDNICLGLNSAVSYTTTESNNIIIGNAGVIADNNTIRIGSVATRTFIDGIDGVNVGSTATVVTEVGDQLGTAVITAGTGISVTPAANLITIAVSGSVGQTITGNTGGPLSPTAGNWNIVTANSTATFVGAVSTLTLDFNQSNLILGNNGTTITIGAANDGFGSGVLQNITSGSSNSAFGNASLQNVTIGSQNTGLGASAGTALNSGGNNTLGGYQSGLLLQSGNSNVAYGYQSGSAWGSAVSNNIAIGSIGSVADSARIRIGTNGTHTSTFIAGIDGVNVGSVSKVITMASDQLGTATLTGGTGITITPGANTITISGTGGGITWSVITVDQTAAVNDGYFCNKAGTLALALPAASVVGDVIENTALGVQFTQAAGQQILISGTNTTLGATGTLTSSVVGDTLKIVCKTANTIWRVTSMVGNWTPA